MSEIISRKEARALGLKRYFTGKLCKHGHLCEREARNGRCLQCHREESALYQRIHKGRRGPRKPLSPEQKAMKAERARQRRIENPEKWIEQQRHWRLISREARRQQGLRRYRKHHEKIRDRINKRNRKKAIALGIIQQLAENDSHLQQLMGEINDALSG